MALQESLWRTFWNARSVGIEPMDSVLRPEIHVPERAGAIVGESRTLRAIRADRDVHDLPSVLERRRKRLPCLKAPQAIQSPTATEDEAAAIPRHIKNIPRVILPVSPNRREKLSLGIRVKNPDAPAVGVEETPASG